MRLLQAIQKRIPLVVLSLLLLATVLLLRVLPDCALWIRNPAFCAMPYLLLVACFLLGACFHQSRISFISLFLFSMMLLLSHSAFVRPDDRMLHSIILLVSVYFPVLVAVFYHMKEQGILSAQGYLKIAIVLSALVVLLLVPKIPSLTAVLSGAGRSGLFLPVSGWLRVPLIGIIMFLFCMPLLMISRAHESPATGPLLGMMTVFVFMGLSFRGTLWKEEAAHSAFILFNSGAGIVLIWLVLESAWRHANIDELTQLPGRRALKMRMDRLNRRYGLAVVDIDHFKKINDKWGHDTGDQVLRYVASQMKWSGAGHVYRFGGEEFVVVSSCPDIKEFEEHLDVLREDVGARPFGIRGLNRPKKKGKSLKKSTSGGNESIKVTVSVGAAVHCQKYQTPDEVLQAADKALYRAKRSGRNRVVSAR